MPSDTPSVTRDRNHRWMVIAFPVCGVVLLVALALRMPSRAAEPSERVSLHHAPVERHHVSAESQPVEDPPVSVAASEPAQAIEETPEQDAVAAASTPVEFFGSQSAADQPDPIEPVSPLSEAELLASLEQTSVEVGLYDNPQNSKRGFEHFVAQVAKTRREVTAEINDLRQRVSRPTRMTRGSQSLLGEVPGATEQMEKSIVVMKAQLEEQLKAAEEFAPLRVWLAERRDLQGLPLAMDDTCRLESHASERLSTVSNQVLRKRFTTFSEESQRRAATSQTDDFKPTLENANQTFAEFAESDPDAFRMWIGRFAYEDYVSGLKQVMQGFPEHMRMAALDTLTETYGPQATAAIAERAVFDPSPEIRAAAIDELQHRDLDEVRPVLLSGLRYVWPPAAQHAADTIVALNDQAARSDLLDLASQPDPTRPMQDESGSWSVHELTRVNHLRNCLLCHAPVIEASVRPTGAIPDPYEPIPVAYYAGSGGSRSASVRADITYLRQDFSIVHEVEDPGPWPKQQRFDYFVRTRELSQSEASEMLSSRDWEQDYPQKRSVLWALQELDAISNRRVIAQN